MPENEFEKKVSSELQQLRFKPSEAVWMRVEERIRKKNKRRVFIILFLLAGFTLLGYWQWDNFFGDRDGEIVKTQTPKQEKTNTVNDKDQTTQEHNKVSNQTQQIKSGDKSDTGEKKVNTNKSTNKIDDKTFQNTISRKIRIESKKVEPTQRKERIPRVDKKDPKPDQKEPDVLIVKDPPTGTTVDSRTVKDSADIESAVTDNVNRDLNQNITPITRVDTIKLDTLVRKDLIKKDSTIKKIDSILKIVPADSPVVNIQKKPTNKKWSFGIEFTPGISSFHEGFLSFNMNKSFADMSGNPASGGGVGSGAGNSIPADPVKSRSAFAFQFGGFFKRQFTQRTSLTLGLRWAYYADEIRIGPRMFPAASSPAFLQLLNSLGVNSAYDAGGVTIIGSNSYHFIELPINYSVQLNKNEAHPLNLQAGVKVGQMFTSNALVYDTAAGGIYYNSKKHFNKTQLGISMSLNWKITKKDKFYMAVGPVFDMHLNSLLDNPLDKKKYLLFAGLRSSVIFNSKK